MGGRSDEIESLYYPGEAALGLLWLYEKDRSNIWLESAVKALAYLARSRKSSMYIPDDNWALLATAKLLSLAGNDDLAVSKELLIDHAIQICENIVRAQIENAKRPEYDGGFKKTGQITPTATRLEGLQAALSFLPQNHEIRKRVDSAVHRGISFLLRAQINEGEFIGAFPWAAGKVDWSTPGAFDFNRRVTEVRIDYVQHASSAMIQYLHLMNDEKW